ncbi:unnamed protein product [Macrosiphum euphorbiae]|uniref:SAP domain-containing protein n=1 Tax=Macrosiphum euphorbiae TaxID=13131 RepID=A0AAV0YA28_9HEMI|nr:unnamed protein product [Macrosiphum euphorbiae]
MSEKTLQQLSSAELRSECTARGLSASGTKSDVYVRLEEHLRASGLVPENVKFVTVQPGTVGFQGSTEQQQHMTSTLENTNASQILGTTAWGNFDKPNSKSKTHRQQARNRRLPVDLAAGPVRTTFNNRHFRNRGETTTSVKINVATNERLNIVRGTFRRVGSEHDAVLHRIAPGNHPTAKQCSNPAVR